MAWLCCSYCFFDNAFIVGVILSLNTMLTKRLNIIKFALIEQERPVLTEVALWSN